MKFNEVYQMTQCWRVRWTTVDSVREIFVTKEDTARDLADALNRR